MDESGGLRERKKRERRRAISRSALELIEERGLAGVTTDAIAERAGISARTFFNYFPSKEAAFIGATDEDFDAYADELVRRLGEEEPLVALRHVVGVMLAPTGIDPQLRARRRAIILNEPAIAPALVRNNLRAENALTAALERHLGLDSGESLDARITVSAAVAAVRACIEHQQSGGSGKLERNIDRAFELLAAGLAPTRTS